MIKWPQSPENCNHNIDLMDKKATNIVIDKGFSAFSTLSINKYICHPYQLGSIQPLPWETFVPLVRWTTEALTCPYSRVTLMCIDERSDLRMYVTMLNSEWQLNQGHRQYWIWHARSDDNWKNGKIVSDHLWTRNQRPTPTLRSTEPMDRLYTLHMRCRRLLGGLRVNNWTLAVRRVMDYFDPILIISIFTHASTCVNKWTKFTQGAADNPDDWQHRGFLKKLIQDTAGDQVDVFSIYHERMDTAIEDSYLKASLMYPIIPCSTIRLRYHSIHGHVFCSCPYAIPSC